MKNKKIRYCYSLDGEIFNDFDREIETPEEAIKWLEEDGVTGKAFIGKLNSLTITNLYDFDDFQEYVEEVASDRCGEGGEDYLRFQPDEVKKDFNAMLEAWATKWKLQPEFEEVYDTKEVELKSEMGEK